MAITSEQIVRAIKIINADATFTFADVDLDTLVWTGDTTAISKSAIEAKLDQAKNEMDAEIQTRIDKKASGKQKLKDLGLDDDEIKALTGA
jgi:hypothetical protein|tara:strand:+ start:535 stop:807 length:273 start_codon:yes stop_codon:yes gene_type:complete